MYDLRVVVEEIKGFCDLPMRVGDYFEVRGASLTIPAGKHMCFWALQSLMPLLPLKQRDSADPNDWVPRTHRMMCPDPNGMVIYRIDRILPDGQTAPIDSSEPIPERLLVDEKVCSGCRTCELACSLKHEAAFAPELARVWVEKDEAAGIDRPHACRQCGVAPCVRACPQEALARDAATHAVTVDRERCIGCGACVPSCPFDAIRMHPEQNIALVCDLCGGQPQCAGRCPTGALRFGRGGNQETR